MTLKEKLKKIIKNNSFLYENYDTGFNFRKTNINKLKSKFKGKRAFIIGNGPSLNKIDLNLLKNEYTFGVNSIFYKTEELGFKPTFYVVEDKHVLNDNLEHINKYDCQYKIFPIQYKSSIKNKRNTYFFNMNTGYYNKVSPYFCVPRFSCDAEKVVFCGQSVTMINLQLAYFLGFTEIYLIGMDHDYVIPKDFITEGETITSTGDDPNHFHPDYFGKGKKWHDPHLDRVERTYNYFKIVFDAKNRIIKNATVGGKLEVFERIDFKTLF
jgi:hypothetical protein